MSCELTGAMAIHRKPPSAFIVSCSHAAMRCLRLILCHLRIPHPCAPSALPPPTLRPPSAHSPPSLRLVKSAPPFCRVPWILLRYALTPP